MTPHLLRCQGFAVAYYGFTLGRLGSEASSTSAQFRCKVLFCCADNIYKCSGDTVLEWMGSGSTGLKKQGLLQGLAFFMDNT